MALIRYRRNRALPVSPWFGGWMAQDPFTDDFFRRFLGDASPADRPTARRPIVHVSENADGYEVTAELAGFSGDDVVVEVDDGVLTFRAERSETRKDEDGDVVVSERHYGTFQRSFRLPDNVDADAITADMKNGVLTLTVPKVEVVDPKPRQIEVHAG